MGFLQGPYTQGLEEWHVESPDTTMENICAGVGASEGLGHPTHTCVLRRFKCVRSHVLTGRL